MECSDIIGREAIEQHLFNVGSKVSHKKLKFHFLQVHDYDCGPACCWMIIKWGNRYFVNDDFSYLDFIQSIEGHIEDGLWTIELLKVLKDYAFRCVYCTININPTPRDYMLIDFYGNSDVYHDVARIRRLFQTVCNETVHIYEGQVALSTIRDFLLYNRSTVVLLLVDYTILYPAHNCCTSKDFSGHYIILLDYSPKRKAFKVADPTRYFRHYIGEKVIERARLSNGTDEDIIFVNLE